jgi:GH15 family glucan-1,4-alpha-glucosidase
MRGTAERIRERLGANGLHYRYLDEHDGLPPGEGAFGICSFWAVQQRVRAGELDVARGEFEHVASFANDLGLFAEEIDPATGAALGNFPQAFTHVGAINAARAIASSSTAAAPPARVEPPGPHDMGEHV